MVAGARSGSPRPDPGRETVLTAVSTLWPSAGAVSIGWRDPGSEAVTFAVVPTVRNPRFLVPRSAGAAVALRPVSQGRRGLQMGLLSLLQRSSLLHRMPGPRLRIARGPSGSRVEDLLSAVLGDVRDVAVRLGRPRPNRTLVVWALDRHGEPAGIAKLSTGSAARAALEVEFTVLAARPAAGVVGLRAPEALGYVRWGENDVLVISALVGAGARPSHEPPVDQMRALARGVPCGDVALRDAPLTARWGVEIATLTGSPDREWLQTALDDLLAEHGDVVVGTGAWHGDWVSWNMVREGATVLLWDWEHYATTALAGFDHVHFLAQELRAEGTGAAVEDRWTALATDALAEHWGMDRSQCAAVLRAYLVEINLRFVRDRDGEEAAVHRQGWGRPLLERLAAAQP